MCNEFEEKIPDKLSAKWIMIQSLNAIVEENNKVVILTSNGTIVGTIPLDEDKDLSLIKVFDVKANAIKKYKDKNPNVEFPDNSSAILLKNATLYPNSIINESQPNITYPELFVFVDQIVGFSAMAN